MGEICEGRKISLRRRPQSVRPPDVPFQIEFERDEKEEMMDSLFFAKF